MKNNVFWIFLFLSNIGFCQQHQIHFQISSGLFSFGGASSSKSTSLNINDFLPKHAYANNPYGKQSGLSYGFGVNYDYITKSKLMFGVQLAYESLSSSILLDKAYGDFGPIELTGKSILTNQFITIFPSIGKGFKIIHSIESELLLGMDFDIGLFSSERYHIDNPPDFISSGTNQRTIPGLDLRAHLELINYFKHFGFSIGYSYGLRNYQESIIGSNNESYARYLRFSIHYRFKYSSF